MKGISNGVGLCAIKIDITRLRKLIGMFLWKLVLLI